MTTEPDSIITDRGTLTLAGVTYGVRAQTFASHLATGALIWLRGPEGGLHYLAPIVKHPIHTGLCDVYSLTTGDRLLVDGAPARVVVLGDVIEPVS